MKVATPKQLFALFCGTKVNTKGLEISKETASTLIQRMKNGDVENVRDVLISYGGTVKGEVKKEENFQKIYDEAHNAGMEAVKNLVVKPMVVQEHKNPLNDNSEVVQSYFVADGICGFASVRFKGNTSFARWAKKNKLCKKSYNSGCYIWISYFNQSYQKKSAYASAFAKVLNENGISAYAESRLD